MVVVVRGGLMLPLTLTRAKFEKVMTHVYDVCMCVCVCVHACMRVCV